MVTHEKELQKAWQGINNKRYIVIKHLSLLSSILILVIGCSSDVMKSGYPGKDNSQEKKYPPIKDFPFEVSIVKSKDKTLVESQYNIEIFNIETKEIQIIEEGKPFKEYAVTDLLKIEDFNNDGYPDILASSIYPSSQTVNTLYIFDPSSRKFIERMDDIPYEGTVSSTKAGCIKVEYIVRNGSDYLKPENFCWSNGKWKLRIGE